MNMKFLPNNTLKTDFLDGERIYWAEEDMWFGDYLFPAYAITDGFSIPKLVQWVFSKNPRYIHAAIPHDLFYKKGQYDEVSRKEADLILVKTMKLYMDEFALEILNGLDGKSFWRRCVIEGKYRARLIKDAANRSAVYSAVRVGGWKSWKKDPLKYWLEGVTV